MDLAKIDWAKAPRTRGGGLCAGGQGGSGSCRRWVTRFAAIPRPRPDGSVPDSLAAGPGPAAQRGSA